MKLPAMTLLLAAMTFGSVPLMSGCERTVSEDKTVKTNPNGAQSTDSTTVKQEPNGDVVKKEVHTNTPGAPNP